MIVADATLTGNMDRKCLAQRELCRSGISFASLRCGLAISQMIAGDVTINPCPVPGDRSWIDATGRQISFGPWCFHECTIGPYPYEGNQIGTSDFWRTSPEYGRAFLTCNWLRTTSSTCEASSFDPKFGWRYQLSESDAHSFRVSARLGADVFSHAFARRCQ